MKEILEKQRAIYKILNDGGKGTSLDIALLLLSKILAQYISSLDPSEERLKEIFKMFEDAFFTSYEVLQKLQKDFPDDLGCRAHAFDSLEEANTFLKKNKKKIEEAERKNDEWAEEQDDKGYN